MDSSTDATHEDRQRFLDLEAAMRLARTKVALGLGAILMPAGAALDWWLQPEAFGILLLVRLVTAALLAAGLVVVARVPVGRMIAPLSVALLLLPAAAIALMIYWGEGGASNYVFGLILLMIFVQLLGFSIGEAIAYCALCIVFYLLAVYPTAAPMGVESSIVAGSFFLITSSLVCVVICQLNRRNRWTDFLLRRSLDDKNRQLEQLDGQRMDFLANISHELRTPLSMILSPLDQLLATRGRLTADVGQPLALVRRNAQRLRVLVDDLLDVVRLDHATFRLQLEDIDAREFLQEVVHSVRSMADARGLSLELDCERELLELRADQHRLERVLLNLLSNAIKFSPADGVVQVRLSRVGDRARIDVEDQGPGIPLEQRSRVFDRLFQGNHGGTPAGLGLGLAISREIVQWHGGEITLSDGPGQRGSRFSVLLPLKQADAAGSVPSDDAFLPAASVSAAARDAQPWLPRSAASAEAPDALLDAPPLPADAFGDNDQAARERVLVIDDEHDLRSFLQSSLQEGFAVAAAATAAEGIALATGWQPRCILLDFMLPDSDGLAVLRQLRREPALGDTKIIMVTAHFDENIKLEALRLGADDFLSKPFGITEVHARVAGLVRSSRLQGELRGEREELRQSLAKLRETEGRLFQSEKMRAVASLAAGLLHEINNPINFTMMAIKALERDLQKGRDPTEVLVDIRDGIQRVADIITDLRAFAYPQQEHVTGSFALADAVATAVRFAAHESDGVPIDASAAAAGLRVHGARSQITQVLLNLILNAVTALRKQQGAVDPAIRIGAHREGDRALVTVSDNGPGIPAAIHRRVMEPFFTTSEPGQGLGLGLSICESIIRSHGGTLSIASQEGLGTQITFDLPLAPLEMDHHEQSADRQASPVCR